MTSVFIRREDTDTEKNPCGEGVRDCTQAKKCLGPPEDGRGKDRFSHRAFGGSMGLLTP